MIDFDKLVLAPLVDKIFGLTATFTPLASQPGLPSFQAQGVYKIDNIDVPMMDGILSSQVITLGVRVADFLVFVRPGDLVAFGDITAVIDDTDEDGQGGSILTLKKIER